MIRTRNLLFAGALLTAATFCLVAQEPASSAPAASEPQDEFVEVVDVDVVNVDVVVEDADGNLVEGLAAEDFRVFEDGREVEITNFHFVKAPERGPRETYQRPTLEELIEEEEGAGEDEGDSEPAESETVVGEAPPVWVVVYLDNRFVRPFDRNKVVRQVRSFLRREIQPGDKVMVASFDRSLNVRQPFTEDLQSVMDQLFELEEVSALQVEADTSRSDVLQRIASARSAMEGLNHADFYAKQIYSELEDSIEAARELIELLAGLPGRKLMIHVSNGLPMTAGEDILEYYDQVFQDAEFSGRNMAHRYDARRKFQQLIAAANTHRVVFYTFEGRGLKPHSSLSADQRGITRDGLPVGSMIDIDFARLMNEQEALFLMAEKTGGVATVGTNNLAGGLEKIAADLRSYYSIGYTTGSGRDGAYHEIEVKVDDPRVKEVRHRAGYRGQDLPDRVADGTRAALHHGFEANPLDVELSFGRPLLSDKGGQYLVPVEVRVPIGQMTLLPRGSRHVGRLRVSLAALDAEGDASGVQQTEVPLSIPEGELERARGQKWVYEAQLLMRPGRQSVAAGVRDELAGKESFLRRSITVGR